MSRYSVDDAAERLEELIDQVLVGELVEVVSASGFVQHFDRMLIPRMTLLPKRRDRPHICPA